MSLSLPKIIASLLAASLSCLASAQPEGSIRLTTQEIKQAFANVRDTAQVQDSAGTSATNLWFEDGRFINQWSNSNASGTVTGRWYAENEQRCVIIQTPSIIPLFLISSRPLR